MTDNTTDPEMKTGEPGYYLLSTQDAMGLGADILKAFIESLKTEAVGLKLEMRVESIPSGLMFWWTPIEEKPDETLADDQTAPPA